jgi:hypothetical protein
MLPGYPRTTQIPIGVANRRWPHGNIDKLMHVAKAAVPWDQRSTLLYIGMDIGTHGSRNKIVAALSKIPGARATKHRASYEEYLKDVAGAKFVAAPRGNGEDTHRAWEVRPFPICIATTLGGFHLLSMCSCRWLLFVERKTNYVDLLPAGYLSWGSTDHSQRTVRPHV